MICAGRQHRSGPLVGDQNEHAQPHASQEPLDEVWWQNYLAQLNNSIVAAEQHLEVPTGTISSIPNDPDFIAIVKTYAVVEPILNDLICSPGAMPFAFAPMFVEQAEGYRNFVVSLHMSGRAGKLKLARGLGLLTADRVAFIEAVTQVRNRYAHNVKNMHRSLAEILMEEQHRNKQIVKHLTGLDSSPLDSSLASVFHKAALKPFMYYRLADYLAEALHTLRPPPLPTGGLAGGLLGLLGR
jgi:hypothetical protein